EAPMPEEDPLVVALAPGLQACNDLGELTVQRGRAEKLRPDVRSQRSEAIVLSALAPVVDEHLVHASEDVERERAHRPVRHQQPAAVEPRRAQDRLRRGQTRRLDDDVGAFDRFADGLDDAHRLAERTLELRAERASGLGALAGDADLIEAEEAIE